MRYGGQPWNPHKDDDLRVVTLLSRLVASIQLFPFSSLSSIHQMIVYYGFFFKRFISGRTSVFFLQDIDGTYNIHHHCFAMHNRCHGVGALTYIQTPLELHRAHVSALHSSHHLYDSGTPFTCFFLFIFFLWFDKENNIFFLVFPSLFMLCMSL